MPAFSSVTTLQDALRVNYSLGQAAQADIGGKVAVLISVVTAMASNLLALQSAALSANASAVTFSALSGVTFNLMSSITNFTSN